MHLASRCNPGMSGASKDVAACTRLQRGPAEVHGTASAECVRIGYCLGSATKRSPGLKPNYQYEKRQREMEKKKKKAEKEQKKAAATETPPAETPPAVETSTPPAGQ